MWMRNQMSRRRLASVPYVSPFSFRKIEVLIATQMPTFMVFKNGEKVVDDLVGANQQGLQVCPRIAEGSVALADKL